MSDPFTFKKAALTLGVLLLFGLTIWAAFIAWFAFTIDFGRLDCKAGSVVCFHPSIFGTALILVVFMALLVASITISMRLIKLLGKRR